MSDDGCLSVSRSYPTCKCIMQVMFLLEKGQERILREGSMRINIEKMRMIEILPFFSYLFMRSRKMVLIYHRFYQIGK